MAGHLVASVRDFLYKPAYLLGNPAKHKEGGRCFKLIKQIEQSAGILFNAQWITVPVARIDGTGKSRDLEIVLYIDS